MVLDGGRGGEHFLAVEDGSELVGSEHVGEGQWVSGPRDPAQVERGDVGRVVEHLRELPGEELELLVAELEAQRARPREPRPRG